MIADPVRGPEPLDSTHDVDEFDCGVASLNGYLTRQALNDQAAEKTRTFVVARGRSVIGYFSLAASAVEPDNATSRVSRGQGSQLIPAILLGRLAVDQQEQGRGSGEGLLMEALARAAAAADGIGARAVLVHAADERARGFYAKYGFEQSPTDPLHLMLLMKDLRKTLRAVGA